MKKLKIKNTESCTAQSFFFWRAAALLALLALALPLTSPAEAAKKKKTEEARPTYAASGPIPGTQLSYENLAVNEYGIVSLTIYNPAATGVSFSANFTFYDGKGQSVANFSLSGFAGARNRNAHMLQMKDYKNFKKATTLKVLGRSGRSVE